MEMAVNDAGNVALIHSTAVDLGNQTNGFVAIQPVDQLAPETDPSVHNDWSVEMVDEEPINRKRFERGVLGVRFG
jgi:hypothetical protein